jgi:hypothetical protein
MSLVNKPNYFDFIESYLVVRTLRLWSNCTDHNHRSNLRVKYTEKMNSNPSCNEIIKAEHLVSARFRLWLLALLASLRVFKLTHKSLRLSTVRPDSIFVFLILSSSISGLTMPLNSSHCFLFKFLTIHSSYYFPISWHSISRSECGNITV